MGRSIKLYSHQKRVENLAWWRGFTVAAIIAIAANTAVAFFNPKKTEAAKPFCEESLVSCVQDGRLYRCEVDHDYNN